MSTHAQAEFEVQSWDESTYEELDGDAKLTRASVGQAFTGDLEGAGSVEWLMCYREDKTADFVGLQRFVGRLGGRSGSFVMHTQGSFDGTEAKGSLAVVDALGHRGAGRHHGQRRVRRAARFDGLGRARLRLRVARWPRWRRDGNVLGALSLVVADQMSDAVAAAADQSLTAAAALSALEHFADGCSVDRLRRILGLTSSGTVRLVDRPGRRGRGAPARGTRRAHDEHRAHRGRAARRAAGDRRPRRRARGRAGRPLPRRARRPRAPGRTRARGRGAPQARARGRRVHALDLPAVRPAGVRARRGPLPGGATRPPRRAGHACAATQPSTPSARSRNPTVRRS